MFTTTRTTSQTQIRAEIRFDFEYLRSYNGMLKGLLLILGIINLIIISVAPVHFGRTTFFNTTLGLAFWYTFVMLILFLCHVPEKFYTLPWLPIEIGVTSIVTLLYFIASLLVILAPDGVHTAAGIFGWITMGVYGYSGYRKFNAWKNGEIAQGSLVQSTSSTTTTQASAFPA